MRVLVVGGTGMIGGHAALHLRKQGHDVTIAGRNPAQPASSLASLPYVRCDYVASPGETPLTGYDALVFAAGNDIRHLPPGTRADAHWDRANAQAVPAFFAAAKAAGVRHAVQVGSFYPQAMPNLVASNSYVASRKAACEGARALHSENFRVVSVNAPFVVGHVPGLLIPMFKAYTQYAQGQLPIPAFAPPGGVNFISTQSLSEAIEGALLRGVNGHAYLVGDENLSFAGYFGMFFTHAGTAPPLAQDQEHPLLPDAAIYFGRGNSLFYQPDADETALLGYRRNDIKAAIGDIVTAYRE